MFTLDTHRKTRLAPAARRWAAGFTLVEILTVVLILGIASAIVAPQIGSRDDLKVRAAARVLIADLLYAQNMAVAQQKYHYVKFDPDAEEYTVMSTVDPSPEIVTIKNPVTKDPFSTKMGPDGNSRLSDVRIKSAVFNGEDAANFTNKFTVAFDELGQPHVYDAVNDKNPLFDGTVVLQCGPHEIAVTIERYTGEIKVP